MVLLASATDLPLLSEVVGFLNIGVLGIVFYLFVVGKLHSHSEFEQVLDTLEVERRAHEHTREALRISNARSEAGVLAADIVARALENSHRLGGADAKAVES